MAAHRAGPGPALGQPGARSAWREDASRALPGCARGSLRIRAGRPTFFRAVGREGFAGGLGSAVPLSSQS